MPFSRFGATRLASRNQHMRPNPNALSILEKLKLEERRLICTGHTQVLDKSLLEVTATSCDACTAGSERCVAENVLDNDPGVRDQDFDLFLCTGSGDNTPSLEIDLQAFYDIVSVRTIHG